MSTTFRCRVVTPTDQLLDEPAVYASIPAWDGLFGVMPGRAPIVAELGMGELRVDFPDSTSAGGTRSFFIDRGFVRMGKDELTVVAEQAIPAERLTVTDAEAELKEADARTVADGAEDKGAEADRITDERRRARAKLALARSIQSSGI